MSPNWSTAHAIMSPTRDREGMKGGVLCFVVQVKQRKGGRRGELLFPEREPQEATWAYDKLELCVCVRDGG